MGYRDRCCRLTEMVILIDAVVYLIGLADKCVALALDEKLCLLKFIVDIKMESIINLLLAQVRFLLSKAYISI